MHFHAFARHSRCSSSFLLACALFPVTLPLAAAAQTEYYNTDVGQPVRIEDAYAVKRYALDVHLAPIGMERARRTSTLTARPEVTYGLLPRTQVEVGVPVIYRTNGDGGDQAGIAGIHVTALHNINAETRSLPAFGVRAGVLLPAGPYGPERAHPAVTGIATRTFRWARVHINAEYTFSNEPTPTSTSSAGVLPSGGLSRWLTGAALDRAFPFHSMLATVQAFVAGPIDDERDVEWNVGGGVRYQLTPSLALDAGAGRRLTGANRAWYLTVGVAHVSSVRDLFPGLGGWGGR